MEVGAVKQAFNNEVILLKKSLNQAKIQVIHKLTRKAKTLTNKKVTDKLKDKLTKKSESAVKEVLIIKKIKSRDIARFMITHTEELKHYLNKPLVDQNKACARLLLHKSLQEKYKFIRGRFANVPIKDLFMSRQERLKLKKEEREKQKNKKKTKERKPSNNNSGEWKIEDVDMENEDNNSTIAINDISGNEDDKDSHIDTLDNDSDIEVSRSDFSVNKEGEGEDKEDVGEDERDDEGEEEEASLSSENQSNAGDDTSDNSEQIAMKPGVTQKFATTEKNNIKVENIYTNKSNIDTSLDKHKKKNKDVNKNKNFNKKILNRNFKKDTEEHIVAKNKVIDPFFITSTGGNYMSVVETREPDEVKEIHKQGNRKFRRAVMFGHVPKIKPKQNNFENNHFGKDSYGNKSNNRFRYTSDKVDLNRNKDNFKTSALNDRSFNNGDNISNEKTEKLHPSWEAKKKQSGILPFQGKKIVFDDS